MKTGGTLLMYVLALLSLMACRTSRNTEQQVNRDYSEELCSLSAQMDSLRAGFQLSQKQVKDKLSNLKVEHTTTYYTLPDSAGKQYPVYVSTTKADKDEQTTEKVQTDMMAAIRRLEAVADSLSRKVDATLKKEQKVAEVSWWDRHKGYVIGAVCGLAVYIILWLLKRIERK